MNNGINLLDYKNKAEVKKSYPHSKLLRMIAVGLLFVVSSLSVIFFILITLSPLPELNRQYKNAVFNLSHSISDIIRLGVINDRTDSIKKIVDSRQHYDQIMDVLQSKLPSGVAFESLSIDGKNITFSVTSNSLLRIDDFLTALIKNNDGSIRFSDITLTKLSSDANNNAFSVDLSVQIL